MDPGERGRNRNKFRAGGKEEPAAWGGGENSPFRIAVWGHEWGPRAGRGMKKLRSQEGEKRSALGGEGTD